MLGILNNYCESPDTTSVISKDYPPQGTSSLPVLSFHISCTVIPVMDLCVVDECTYDVLKSLFSVNKQKIFYVNEQQSVPIHTPGLKGNVGGQDETNPTL